MDDFERLEGMRINLLVEQYAKYRGLTNSDAFWDVIFSGDKEGIEFPLDLIQQIAEQVNDFS